MNTLFNQLSQNNYWEIINLLRQSNNPHQLLNTLANNNPTIAQMLKELQSCNGDAKTLFYQKAQQAGINPNMILNQLK